jgi:hypothetical protein
MSIPGVWIFLNNRPHLLLGVRSFNTFAQGKISCDASSRCAGVNSYEHVERPGSKVLLWAQADTRGTRKRKLRGSLKKDRRGQKAKN